MCIRDSSFTASNSLTGASSSAGTSCWTSVAGPSAYTNEQFTSPHGATTADGAHLISCGAASASAPVFSYEEKTGALADAAPQEINCAPSAVVAP